MKLNETLKQHGRVCLTLFFLITALGLSSCGHSRPMEEPGVKSAEASPIQEAIPEIKELKMVNFEFNSSEISKCEKDKLDSNVSILNQYPKLVIWVEGFCDERGSEHFNLLLSQRRAESVRSYLIAKGISPERLWIRAYGKSNPVDHASTEGAYEKNRRATFAIPLNQVSLGLVGEGAVYSPVPVIEEPIRIKQAHPIMKEKKSKRVKSRARGLR